MTRRHAYLLVSGVAWGGFLLVIAWTAAFLAGVVVDPTVDASLRHPQRLPTAGAVGVDVGLLLLFAVQHSVMARRPVKERLRRWLPAELERATYVLATDACLVLLLLLWQPWDGQVWLVEGPLATVLWVLCAAGWLLAIVATNAVDHLELVGLRQAGWGRRHHLAGDGSTSSLHVTGLYAVVRHPLMTGLLLAFWATPRMSAPHLLFATATTAYVAVGIHFEERDLRRTFGRAYADYAARVPALLPILRPRVTRP
ncbi:isoprenylcysteine carboxylmethyltransferase family protein [Terrabacter aeriphilus]|uniref:Isoprenylcysteine carboxylmethyltransferase family protein n=1 Tax=Terrabacter aeriphilus TaxID=515662 RepID=A0ABP9J0W6_9MICO